MARSILFLWPTLLLGASMTVLAAAAGHTQDYYWMLLMRPPNEPPVIDSEVDITFVWPNDSVRLNAVVADYPADKLVYTWTQLSGPAGVKFDEPVAEDITAIFPRYGDYLLQLSVSDGEFTTSVEVAVTFDFLRNYINPIQHKLPMDRVYPMGQRMMITAWVLEKSNDIALVAANGFTMAGPNFYTSTDRVDGTATYTKREGMRMAHRIVNGASTVSELLPMLDGGVKEADLYKRIQTELLRAVNNPLWNEQIDIWLTGTEEISTRNDSHVEELNRYLQNFKRIITEFDPQQRPLWMSDVTGVTMSEMMVTYSPLDMVGPQIYLNRTDPAPGGYDDDAVIGKITRTIVNTAEALDRLFPVKRPRPATGSLDFLYEFPESRRNQEFIERVTEHNLYLALNNGLNGFQLYRWYRSGDPGYLSEQSWLWLRDAYLKHVKALTDYRLDYAYLWGDSRSDLTMEILSGPEMVFNAPSISMQNIQHEQHRFLILTNTANDPVEVQIGNIPRRCAKVLDIREGEYLPKASSFTTIMGSLGVRIYRFEEDGDC